MAGFRPSFPCSSNYMGSIPIQPNYPYPAAPPPTILWAMALAISIALLFYGGLRVKVECGATHPPNFIPNAYIIVGPEIVSQAIVPGSILYVTCGESGVSIDQL